MKISCWWPGMDKDIEKMIQACYTCSKLRPQTLKTIDKWDPCGPFERLHMDWAFVPQAGNVLIIADAGTGWIEAYPTRNRESTTVIKCLRTVFTRFGTPYTLVSDNAKEFISTELNDWLRHQGVVKKESPLYSPRSNGLAERAVQTVKRGMNAWRETQTHCDFNTYLQRILFHHRISSHARGKFPAELAFGRQLRAPVLLPFQQGDETWYVPNHEGELRDTVFLMPKGRNTSWLINDENELLLASNNQIAPRPKKTESTAHNSPENIRNDTEDLQEEREVTPGNEKTVEANRTDPQPSCRMSTRTAKPPKRYGYDN